MSAGTLKAALVLCPLTLLAGPSAAQTSSSTASLSGLLGSWGARARFGEGYSVVETSTASFAGLPVETARAAGPAGRIVRLERVTGADAAQGEGRIKDKLVLLESMYDPHPDPYFALITKRTVCPERYRASYEKVRGKGPVVHVVTLYANDRLTFGACTDDTTAFRAVLAMTFCPGTGTVVYLESFVPLKDFTKADGRAVRSLKCL